MHDVAQAGHAGAAVGRAVHDRGVQLDDPVLVGRAPEADAMIVRVGLDDGHAGDRRVHRVGPLLDHLHGDLDRLEVAAGDDDGTLRADRLRLRRADGQRAEAQAREGRRPHEVPPVQVSIAWTRILSVGWDPVVFQV